MKLFNRVVRKMDRSLTKVLRLKQARKLGLAYIEPNFLYLPTLKPDSIVIDAGCSYEADFSVNMIRNHKAKAYAVDPTLKHKSALEKLETAYGKHFVHLPFAIASVDGTLTFHESKTNESGSLMDDHTNVKRDETISYEVPAVTLRSLLDKIGVNSVDILKLDIEGAEYQLLGNIRPEDLSPFKQIFIEFHHHAVSRYSQADTEKIARRIGDFGFNMFSLDNHNYIFWK